MSKPGSTPPPTPTQQTPPKTLTRKVRNSAGEFGDRLRLAEADMRAEGRKLGLQVVAVTRGPAKVVGQEEVDHGLHEDGKTHIIRKVPVCEIVLTAELAPMGPERWVRLTTRTGPCAVEILETEGGKITGRREYHPEDVRNVSWGFAESALTEMAGP